MSWQTPKKDWTRADGVRNTDLNRIEENIEYVYDNFEGLRRYVDDALFVNSQRLALSDLSVGAEFALYEHGTLVPYLKLHGSYGDTDRVLVLRKNIYSLGTLQELNVGYYSGSFADSFLNEDYITALDDATQTVLTPVNIKVAGFTGIETIARKAFLLSRTEYNISGTQLEGTINTYFSSPARRIATLNGAPQNHWTRTVMFSSSEANYINSEGTIGAANPTQFTAGIRPAFTLPQNFHVITRVPDTANTLALAEVM